MNDHNLLSKWLFVGFVVLAAVLLLWPPDEKLKYGIDLQGGTSLLFEIDTSGLTPVEQSNLSARVMNILKDRVDPTGSLNLVWRPVGNTRLEIQMPQPSEKAKRRRQAKEAAESALVSNNVPPRGDVELALNAPQPQRDETLQAMIHGIEGRRVLIEQLQVAYAAMLEDPADEKRRTAYEEVMDKLLATNLNVAYLNDILQLSSGSRREREIEKIKADHPAFQQGIDAYVKAYDGWAKDKSGLEDPSDLKRLLRGAGVLEFRILADRDLSSPAFVKSAAPELREPVAKYVEALGKRGPRAQAGDHYRWFPVKDIEDFMNLEDMDLETFDARRDTYQQIIEKYAGRYYCLVHNDPDYGLLRPQGGSQRRWKLQRAYPDRDYQTGRNCVSFTLDPVGGELFGELTGANIQRQLAIILDGDLMSHATIISRIGQRGQISGTFSTDEVRDLVQILEAGALPGRLKETPLMEKTVGPSIGADNRDAGLRAAYIGFALVVVFMAIYYGLAAGLVADLALLLNVVLVLGTMAMLQATFTLPGIAGLILTVGMAVDSNVLIFERWREERDRGVPFRKALNLGYDKALFTIVDANLTTLIICVILGYAGSEEVKGFAISLGMGIATSMFTALFVTRLVFNTLINRGWLKDFSMHRLLSRQQIDWLSMRRIFWPISTVIVLGGLGGFLYVANKDPEAMFDIEFLGGTSVQVDFKEGARLEDEEISIEAVRRVITSEESGADTVVNWLANAAESLRSAKRSVGEGGGQFLLTSDALHGDQMATLLRSKIEDRCDSISADGNTAVFVAKPGEILTLEAFGAIVDDAARNLAERTVEHLRSAKMQSVSEVAEAEGPARSFEIVTVETNRDVVQEAIVAVLGNKLEVEPSVAFEVVEDPVFTLEPYFAVRQEAQYLREVIGGDANFDIRRYKGGVAMVVDRLNPPLTSEAFDRRLREASLRPEAQQTLDISATGLFPLSAADAGQAYTKFAVLMVSDTLPFSEDEEERWADFVAVPALAQVKDALAISKSLRKVVQFAPQVAVGAKQDAMVAIVLSLAAIVVYVWIRFGTMQYGLAGIVALVHDVAVALGAVTITDWVADTPFGMALGIVPTKIDLAIVAALLTLIGYSINDTIVIFDRIRENRGKSHALPAAMINQSINETLSRTILTTLLTLLVVLSLYIVGGPGIRGFSFVLLVGMISGTYSTLAVAVPLLYRPAVLHLVVRVIVAGTALSLVFVFISSTSARLIWIAIIAVALAYWSIRSRQPVRRGGRPAMAT